MPRHPRPSVGSLLANTLWLAGERREKIAADDSRHVEACRRSTADLLRAGRRHSNTAGFVADFASAKGTGSSKIGHKTGGCAFPLRTRTAANTGGSPLPHSPERAGIRPASGSGHPCPQRGPPSTAAAEYRRSRPPAAPTADPPVVALSSGDARLVVVLFLLLSYTALTSDRRTSSCAACKNSHNSYNTDMNCPKCGASHPGVELSAGALSAVCEQCQSSTAAPTAAETPRKSAKPPKKDTDEVR